MSKAITRGEFDMCLSALRDLVDAGDGMFAELNQQREQADALRAAMQSVLADVDARMLSLGAVCSALARGFISLGVPPSEVAALIARSRTALPDHAAQEGGRFIDALASELLAAGAAER